MINRSSWVELCVGKVHATPLANIQFSQYHYDECSQRCHRSNCRILLNGAAEGKTVSALIVQHVHCAFAAEPEAMS
jgi:hypothetical protein